MVGSSFKIKDVLQIIEYIHLFWGSHMTIYCNVINLKNLSQKQ